MARSYEEMKERLKTEPFYLLSPSSFVGLNNTQIANLLPKKCSVCKSMRHNKSDCPLVKGYAYLELFRGLQFRGEVNLREEYGWGDASGYVEFGWRQSFTTNPLVAALFALHPKNSALNDVSNLDEFAEQAGVMNEFGHTFAAEAWLKQTVSQAERRWRSDPYTHSYTWDDDGNRVELPPEFKSPFVLRCVAKVTEEEMKQIDIMDMNYQNRFAIEQEFETKGQLKLTHIGVPMGCHDWGDWIRWAKYEEIPPEKFENAVALYEWITYEDDTPEEYYDEEEDEWVFIEHPNSKNNKEEFGNLWWPMKVPIAIQAAVNEEDDFLEMKREHRNAWDYFFRYIPDTEQYRLSPFRQLQVLNKKKNNLLRGRDPWTASKILSKQELGYQIHMFNEYLMRAEKWMRNYPKLDNPYKQDYVDWYNQTQKKDEQPLATMEMFEDIPYSLPNPRWA